MYWNGLPITDGGGNTYFNLTDFSSIGSIEIIKGPGSSLYGAGTGGVVLLSSIVQRSNGIQLSSSVGSFGLQRYQIAYQGGGNKIKSGIQYAHQQVTGYRDHSAMERNTLNADLRFLLGKKSTLSWMSFYSNLFYKTPGGLTLAQYESDPISARPATAFSPGAVEQKAAIHNKTIYSGLVYESQWSSNWSGNGGIFVSQTSFDNPSIRNYESRDETNMGGRAEAHFTFDNSNYTGKLTAGFEGQYFFSPIGVFDNNGGVKTTIVQSEDELKSLQGMSFLQIELDLPKSYFLTLGSSVSLLSYNFLRENPGPALSQTRNFKAELSPRIALLKKFKDGLSIFASISNGFSPPSLAEVRPSTNAFNNDLNAERGTNSEIGFRGHLLKRNLQFDLTFYDFKLRETIVIQRAADGAEFFVNAGKTDQKGIEALITWRPKITQQSAISNFVINGSYTYSHYRFLNYVQDGNDYSGNRLTGVPPVVFSLALDVELRKKIYFNFTGSFTDHISLNDMNSVYAPSFLLVGLKAGYKLAGKSKLPFEAFVGADNLLNEKYSLGNDLNAFGGRYFNAAATRNYYGGVKILLAFKN